MSNDAVEEASDDDGDDASPIDWVRFAFRAAGRRKKLSRATFLFMVGLTVAAAVLWPRTYSTESKIVVERNAIMPALADPHRAVPVDYEAPTKGAQDAILARDNLENLVRQTNLEQRWTVGRPVVLRAKDAAMGLFRPPPSEADKQRALVAMLEKGLRVTVDNTSISIGVDWDDPVSCYDIVTTVQKNYLDARHNVEVSVISEAIAILEEHANEERDNVAAALTEMQRLRSDQQPLVVPPPAASGAPQYRYVPAPGVRATAPSGGANNADLLKQLDDKRKAIRGLEDARQRRLNELNGQLTDLRATLAAAHPAVLEVERTIEAARTEAPELVTLRSEERDLLARIAAANDTRSTTGAATAQVLVPVPVATSPLQREPHGVLPLPVADDTLVEAQRQKLQSATIKYQDLMDRIDSARIELETARAAFKYRYSVVVAPEVSKSPKKPNVPVVVGVGVLLAFLLALVFPMGADLASGRVMESWQAERRLKLPVLGEVTRV
ncbi:MAG TPA: hypothetical protein VF316_10440 [Polyangiaceae bacterium]